MKNNEKTYVVTLADREPWTSLARALGEIVESLDPSWYKFHCETTAHNERPWQAKRFAVRKAFEEGSNKVYWIDADHEILNAELLGHFLAKDRKTGLYTSQLFPGRAPASIRRWGRKPHQAGSKKNLKIYQSCLTDNNLVTSTHFSGSILAYIMDSETGLKLCSIWDKIAQKLLINQITWTDEISIGIAADTLKIPIVPDLHCLPGNCGLKHLKIGKSRGYFL
jgi:hypothetical protein